ncbi:MAG: methionyl-tRNA formyltransferase [Treponema sp.]|jgi:methionyl-tRNA formyltransferase|nr:methionyl-tRNA formyltransferase [Treponema sp.]
MRILFAGTPAIAVPSLNALAEMEKEGIVLAGVLTNPDRPRRHGAAEPSDVSAAAFELDVMCKGRGFPPIPQLKPEKLDALVGEEVAALTPDILVSFAYGRFFGPRFLALFPLGGINIHPSLLPKYRGASPIPAQILAGEKETGICIQRLAQELDAGDILAAEVFGLSARETTVSLSETVSWKAARLLRELLLDFGSRAVRPQEGEAIYCHEIKKEAGAIDWGKSAVEIDAQIRAYTPWPLSFTHRGKNTLLILEAMPFNNLPETPDAAPGTVLGTDRSRGILIQTGKGILAVTRLQWQTKKALDWKSFCNGERDFVGTRLA